MAWTTPKTWASGYVVLAADLNTHVRDNFNAITALLDLATGSFTDGGILLGSGTGAFTAMAVLADGAIAVGDGTTDPVALTLLTSSTGTVTHEKGGLEFDASAIALGGMIKGSGAGTMGLLTKGTAETILTMNAGATDFAWVAPAAAAVTYWKSVL